jgi:hypothetical protein
MALGQEVNKLALENRDINEVLFYDLKSIFDERRANMVLGQGVEIKSDDDKFLKVFRQIDKHNKLDDLLLT